MLLGQHVASMVWLVLAEESLGLSSTLNFNDDGDAKEDVGAIKK